ncbi:MAG: asparagine synthase (glutamine-hydrolyzing) [bacterium]
MCGICGIIDFNRGLENGADAARRMCDALRHRGPDDEGVFADGFVAIGNRRLSIIDVEGGRQPIFNEDGSVAVVFNGEIYNFQTLRADLKKKGHRFRTRADTETIVHLYEERGDRCVESLRGMFAFALYDIAGRRVVLARDRVGIKPLVYLKHGSRLLFASEIKAFLALNETGRRLHLPALFEYLAHLYIPGEHTIFEGIRRLPPGSLMTVDAGGVRSERYWRLRPPAVSERAQREWEEEIIHRLRESVREHLVSDVPVGAFLSGGIDSSAVTALASQVAGVPVRTYSIGFPERSYSELPYARVTAEKFGTDHRGIMVEYPKLDEFIPEILRCFSEPFADAAALPTYLIAREASRDIKVILSGSGGDELFAGYAKYAAEPLARRLSAIPRLIRARLLLPAVSMLPETVGVYDPARRIKRLLRYSLQPEDQRPVMWINGFDSAALRRLLKPDIARELDALDPLRPLTARLAEWQGDDTLARTLFTEFSCFLPSNNLHKDDILGMAHSIEIRVPFLDHEFVEFAFSIPSRLKLNGTATKHILKQALRGLLPPRILSRRKQGFSAPIGVWLKNELRPLCEDLFFDRNSVAGELFQPAEMRRLLGEHLRGRADHSHRLWALLMFFVWEREFLR